jgi:hypothetical protein
MPPTPPGLKNKPPPTWQHYLQRSIDLPSLSSIAWPAPASEQRIAPTLGLTPVEWAESHATIVHPSRGRVPFVPYPYQRDFLASYATPRRIVLKARQIGFSQVFALEALYAAIHEPESTILLVSRSQDLAVNLLRYCYQAYGNLVSAPALKKQNESEMGFVSGSRIKSIPANRTTGRGFAATRVYLDEFAYADYADDIYQSISPAISQGGALTIGSTPNGTGNLFHSLYLSGAGFTRQTVPWHHCPAYYTDAERTAGVPPEESQWYGQERPNHTAQAWAAEYECDFVGSGVAVFDAAAIDAAEQGAIGEQEALPGHWYVNVADIGRRQDATVINTIDVTQEPYQRVRHERIERAPYPIIQQRLEARARAYPGLNVVESNGVGDPVIENTNAFIQPFVTSARSKVQAIQSLQLLLEHRRFRARWTDQERRELIGYQWDDRDLVQDCVMSLAIGAASIANMGTPGI